MIARADENQKQLIVVRNLPYNSAFNSAKQLFGQPNLLESQLTFRRSSKPGSKQSR